MANFIMSLEWHYWIILIAIIFAIYNFITTFAHKPTQEQINSITAWLLIAVAEAEKELGSGTGQLKLAYVYNKFITTFPTISKYITYATFSKLVDEALVKFKDMLNTNTKVKEYINK